jgi:putative ABC transport system ATP-binding protein
LNIRIEKVIPVPLKENLKQRHSQIWQQTFLFEQPKWYHIKAASGLGKSTFIHSLYGLRKDYEGIVFLNEQNIRQINSEKLATIRQSSISIVFQDLRLFTSLTGRENILIKQSLKAYHSAEKVESFAEKLSIQHRLDQPCGTMSYGEQQRIAIIRALMQPFDWLLLDEPFSHLDHVNVSHAALLIGDECKARKAGIIIADLEDDNHFSYSQKLLL